MTSLASATFGVFKPFIRGLQAVFPDRGTVGMTAHALRSYSLLLIKTCHK